MNRKGPIATRRQILRGAAGAAAVSLVGCHKDESGGKETGTPGTLDTTESGTPDTGPLPDLGDPEIAADLWQTMCPYVRATADGTIGCRVNLYNPADVPHRVVIQVFTAGGVLVAREVVDEAFAAGRSDHIELADLLARNSVPLPFEGSLWVGATPASGDIFMGLQGIVFDWYGPSHAASVHGLRDFGNSDDQVPWTDLILPKVVNTARYVTMIAIANASADGVSEALIATPEVIVRDDQGVEIVSTQLEPLGPYESTVFAVTDLPGGEAITTGTIQIREEEAGLVAFAFLHDRDNGGFATADHFFDRHFVVHGIGFIG